MGLNANEFRVLTRRAVIAAAPARYAAQYAGSGNLDMQERCKALQELTCPSKGVIDAIIGDTSWTRLNCELCEQDVTKVLRYGDGEYSHNFCQGCLEEMLDLLKEGV